MDKHRDTKKAYLPKNKVLSEQASKSKNTSDVVFGR